VHPALSLVVDDGRLVRGRALASASWLVARAAGMRAYAIWPSLDRPHFGIDVGRKAPAAWIAATFEPGFASRAPSPAAGVALRARALLLGRPSSLTLEAARQALGRAPRKPRLSLYSPTGSVRSKASCFVFDAGEAQPACVVKALPEGVPADRLRRETELVEELRDRIDAGDAAALPLPPLLAGEVRGRYVVVQPTDPLAAATGRVDDDAALTWLRRFHASTTVRTEPLGAAGVAELVDLVRKAWSVEAPGDAVDAADAAAEVLEPVADVPVPRSAVHGDFWRGNLAARDGRLRVYDWEWAEHEGDALFDLWTWHLAELKAPAGGPPPDLRAPLDAVESEFEARGLDRRLALALLVPSAARLAYRFRWATGVPAAREPVGARIMQAALGLLP
jgi:hypothetical protein